MKKNLGVFRNVWRQQRVEWLILWIVLLRGLLFGLVIPFDQSPDEHHHFRMIKAKQWQLERRTEEEKRAAAAQVQLTWMQLNAPEEQFSAEHEEQARQTFLLTSGSSWHLYYTATAFVLKLAALDSIRDEIYLIRLFSVCCGIVVVYLAIVITRDLFPDQMFIRIGVPVFIAFIPQFSAMNGVISNDKFAEVFCALALWLIIKIFKQGIMPVTVSAYVLFIGCALLSKRTTVFLIPLSILVVFVYFWKASLDLRMHLVLGGSLLGLLLTGFVILSNSTPLYSLIDDHVISLPPVSVLRAFLLRPELYSSEYLKAYAKFFIVMYWSFWGTFGYMTLHLHHFWYLLAAGVQGVAGCGLIALVWRMQRKSIRFERWQTKTLYVFLISVILIVLTPFLRSVVFNPGPPGLTQGRYLFTTLIPISLGTILGLATIIPRRWHRWAGGCGFVGLVILDMVCLSKYILLNFHFVSLF